MTVRAVVVEGLPGAGKSTLLRRLSPHLPDVTVLPELVLPAPATPDADFFVRNDRAKGGLLGSGATLLLDRYWPSSIAYRMAERRLAGEHAEVGTVIAELFDGRLPDRPSAFVHLDPPRAEEHAYAADGLFPHLEFRVLLRLAYREIFRWTTVPVFTSGDDPQAGLLPFVRRHLDLSPFRLADGTAYSQQAIDDRLAGARSQPKQRHGSEHDRERHTAR
jgi:hypothetical protein